MICPFCDLESNTRQEIILENDLCLFLQEPQEVLIGKSKGAVMASDAFFPFPDTVEVAAKYGISAIIQPGGSLRDESSIEACNLHGIAMVFTGVRHFRH